MPIGDAGNDRLAAEIEHTGRRHRMRRHRGIGPHRDDALAGDRNRLRNAEIGVDGDDFAVLENEIRWRTGDARRCGDAVRGHTCGAGSAHDTGRFQEPAARNDLAHRAALRIKRNQRSNAAACRTSCQSTS
jgi:hypothetical protein